MTVCFGCFSCRNDSANHALLTQIRASIKLTQETVHNSSDSRMNLPSLYFSLASYALSYFHPTTSLHCLHIMSLTMCRPVVIFRSIASPCLIFTTEEKRKALPCWPRKFLEMISSKSARCVLHDCLLLDEARRLEREVYLASEYLIAVEIDVV